MKYVLLGIAFLLGVTLTTIYFSTKDKEMDSSKKTNNYSEITMNLEETHPDKFGGVYVDSEGVWNVNWVGDADELERSGMDKSKVKVNEVTFSYAYLQEQQSQLRGKMQDLKIHYMGVDVPANKLLIYVKALDASTEKKILEMVDPLTVEIKESEGAIQFN